MIKNRKNRILFIVTACILVAMTGPARSKSPGKPDSRTAFRDSMVKQVIEIEKVRVIGRADRFLSEKPRTVTASSCPRSEGGKHDFYSEGPYWWPDPANPSGPFIRKDGIRFPGRFQNHDDDLRNFSWMVGTFASAWLLTGQEKYVKAALLHMNAWFADTTTRMNPNMLYAQAVRGVNSGRGTGIIDALPLMDVARSAMILEKSQFVTAGEIAAVKEWFRQFIAWLTTHPYGIDEMKAKNNHGSWWFAQVAAYADLVGDRKVLEMCEKRYREVLLPNQMAPDGSYPEELARTKPYSYSLFNLDATASLLWILSDKSFEIWNYTLPDGRGLWKGLNWMLPYLEDKTKWPGKKDVDHWDQQPDPRQFMLFAAIAGNNRSWFEMWKSLTLKSYSDEGRIAQAVKNPLIWIGSFTPYTNNPGTGDQVREKKPGNGDFKKSLLFADNFDAPSNNWLPEFENPGSSSLTISNGRMDISSFLGATIWFKNKLSGNIEISYSIRVVDTGGKNDRVSDLNAFWMASDPSNPNLFTRKGKFSSYDNLELYYAGVGGNGNSTTRFRKYHRDGEKPVLKEYTDKEHLLQGNLVYQVKIICYNGLIQFYRDNVLYFDFQDNTPYTAGWFGFRTTRSHLQVENFRVMRLEP